MILKLLVEGGAMKPGPAVAQKLGPIGINLGKVIEAVNKATEKFKGMKVPVILDINTKTKEFKVEVRSPPTAELLKKELGIEKGSGEPNKIKVANAALEQIIAIAKVKAPEMLSELKESVKSILGTSSSLGILVETKNPKDIIREVEAGKHDELIAKAPPLSEEKKTRLQTEFETIKAEQEKMLAEEAAKEAAEAAEAEKAAEVPPEAEEVKPEEAKPEEKAEEKEEEKKEEKEKKGKEEKK